MLRKLIIVGMLTLVQQGSTGQVCAGLTTCFFFFAAHVHTKPYRHIEDNVLKATTELHLFLMMLLVMACKTDMENERFDVNNFDSVATVMFIIFVPVTALLCIASKWRTVAKIGIEAASLQTHTARLQSAFRRHRVGRDTEDDRQLLGTELHSLSVYTELLLMSTGQCGDI